MNHRVDIHRSGEVDLISDIPNSIDVSTVTEGSDDPVIKTIPYDDSEFVQLHINSEGCVITYDFPTSSLVFTPRIAPLS